MNVQTAVTIATVAVVAGGVAAGFAAIGPPSRTRIVALDERRVDDLRTLVMRLRDRNGTLPPSLRNDPPEPRDPVTGAPYVYVKESAATYLLCATFAEAGPPGDPLASWHHPAGPACYRLSRGDLVPDGAAFRRASLR